MWWKMCQTDWMFWETFLPCYLKMLGMENIFAEDKVILKAAFDIDQEVDRVTFEQYVIFIPSDFMTNSRSLVGDRCSRPLGKA